MARFPETFEDSENESRRGAGRKRRGSSDAGESDGPKRSPGKKHRGARGGDPALEELKNLLDQGKVEVAKSQNAGEPPADKAEVESTDQQELLRAGFVEELKHGYIGLLQNAVHYRDKTIGEYKVPLAWRTWAEDARARALELGMTDEQVDELRDGVLAESKESEPDLAEFNFDDLWVLEDKKKLSRAEKPAPSAETIEAIRAKLAEAVAAGIHAVEENPFDARKDTIRNPLDYKDVRSAEREARKLGLKQAELNQMMEEILANRELPFVWEDFERQMLEKVKEQKPKTREEKIAIAEGELRAAFATLYQGWKSGEATDQEAVKMVDEAKRKVAAAFSRGKGRDAGNRIEEIKQEVMKELGIEPADNGGSSGEGNVEQLDNVDAIAHELRAALGEYYRFKNMGAVSPDLERRLSEIEDKALAMWGGSKDKDQEAQKRINDIRWKVRNEYQMKTRYSSLEENEGEEMRRVAGVALDKKSTLNYNILQNSEDEEIRRAVNVLRVRRKRGEVSKSAVAAGAEEGAEKERIARELKESIKARLGEELKRAIKERLRAERGKS